MGNFASGIYYDLKLKMIKIIIELREMNYLDMLIILTPR